MENAQTNNSKYTDQVRVMTAGDYLSILNRRKLALLIPFLLVFAAGAMLAFLLPSVYRADATVLIERQEIPKELVETTVTGFVQERIEGLNKRLLTRDNLWSIAETFDLYADRRTQENRYEILSEMKESISVDMVDVKTNEPDAFKQGLATVAFTVAFESEDPQNAEIVANELASLYIEENERSRSEQALEVSNFLIAEGDRLNKELSELESKLAEFKQSEQSQLPELMNLNLKLYEKTENEIQRTLEQIRQYEDRITALQAEIAITPSHQDIIDDTGRRVVSGDERLSLLTAEYIRLSSRYASQHPDLIKLRREIEALGGERDVSGVTALIKKLTTLKNELAAAQRKYSDDHPDVVSKRRSVAAVERGLQASSVPSIKSNSAVTAPNSPRYVSLKTQIDAAIGNLSSERSRLAQQTEKLNDYETRLFNTPGVERDYKLLTRDYEGARKKYAEIKNKQAEARMAIDLEASSKSERFAIVQPAIVPSLPERPNRIGIMLLSFLLASAAGVGMAAIREYLDLKIYNVRDLRSVFPAPPLVSIPYIPAPK